MNFPLKLISHEINRQQYLSHGIPKMFIWRQSYITLLNTTGAATTRIDILYLLYSRFHILLLSLNLSLFRKFILRIVCMQNIQKKILVNIWLKLIHYNVNLFDYTAFVTSFLKNNNNKRFGYSPFVFEVLKIYKKPKNNI